MNELTYDKNAKKIIIPDGTKIIEEEQFLGYDKLEEIVLPPSLEYIEKSAFLGCKSLKKINLPDNVILDDYVFADCESLEEITLPSSLKSYPLGLFENCYNLKTVTAPSEIKFIDDKAFYNCHNLENFNIPKTVTYIGYQAFMGCNKIKEITIPKNCTDIGARAFSLMESLEKITVEDDNLKYVTNKHNTLLISKDCMVVQYAINANNKDILIGSFSNGYHYDQIHNISDYAFAGAKKLEKICLDVKIESIGANTFLNCDNLKNLEIFNGGYAHTHSLSIHKNQDEEAFIPFENIVIDDGIKYILSNMSDLFKNAKKVELSNTLEFIGKDVFSKSDNLSILFLPDTIKFINKDTFNPNIELFIPNIGYIKASNFNMLNIKSNVNNTINIISYKDGTYYIKIDNYEIIKVHKDQIRKLTNDLNLIEDNPDQVIVYLINLLNINIEYNEQLINACKNELLKDTLKNILNNKEYIKQINSYKMKYSIKYFFDNIDLLENEFIFNTTLIKYLNKAEFIEIIENYNEYLDKFFKLYKVDEDKNSIINIYKIIKYCNLLKKYNMQDKFLYNPIFIEKLDETNQELLIKNINKNIKHLLENSKALKDSYGNNLNDLINMCNALGVFGEDSRIGQQITTFIIEKMFTKGNENIVIGNDIHTIFGEIKPRKDTDYQFTKFFIQNYNELIKLEKNKSGIIAQIYNSFDKIKKTATSHKGSQRQLEVTIPKCLDYLLSQKFDGVNESNKDLALLLQEYYTEPYVLKIADNIIKESSKAPRNIFDKIYYDEFGNIKIEDVDDLIDDKNSFSYYYEWLPKQDYNNLILGKNCSCCAHLLGAGAGIMRASMILDNCQNLVIRNENDKIIAKMTIYVNKEEGYAVFNTAEVNMSYNLQKKQIFEAFIRGTNAFVERYNSNNEISIKYVSIGEYRNGLIHYLDYQHSKLFQTPNYSDYGYIIENRKIGTYDGDSKEKQILVLKK